MNIDIPIGFENGSIKVKRVNISRLENIHKFIESECLKIVESHHVYEFTVLLNHHECIAYLTHFGNSARFNQFGTLTFAILDNIRKPIVARSQNET